MKLAARLALVPLAALAACQVDGHDVYAAMGVGGAPGGRLDEPCAVAGIDKVKDQLQ